MSFPSFHALIIAAGSGLRAGGGVPKQHRLLAGRAMLHRAAEPFIQCDELKSLTIVLHPDRMNDPLPVDHVRVVAGGATRSESVAKGLAAVVANDDELILIHDAARPFVTPADIRAVTAALQSANAATLAAPVTDTLRHENGGAVSRDGLWALQTPQGFRAGVIRAAHRDGGAATDDTALVAALGEAVTLVPGSPRNFKVTTAEDFTVAEALLAGVTRTGFGFDVHAFDPSRAGPVRLCGVDIAYKHPLLGHSDADVGMHAITDALLGAIAAGDIGEYFPPSDPQWRGAESGVFLRHAAGLVAAAGGTIVNVDLTLLCEAPKIGPHRAAMQARVAECCGIAPSQVGIKATTNEGLGYVGRGEGIAAQAVATVRLPW